LSKVFLYKPDIFCMLACGDGMLTALQIKGLKDAISKKTGRRARLDLPARRIAKHYRDSKGLYLQVGPAKDGGVTRCWIFRYMIGGTARTMGLGPYPEISIAQARKLASEWRARMQGPDAVDRLLERRRQRVVIAATNERRKRTFAVAFNEWFDRESVTWSNDKYRKQVRSLVERNCKTMLHRPVNEINDAAVRGAVEPVITTRLVTGKNLAMYIRQVLDHASAHGWRDKGPNPAAWEGNLDQIYSGPRARDVQHFEYVPVSEMPDFAGKLRKLEGVPARALEFLMLTVARTGNVVAAKWDQIDLQARTWRIPKTKNGKPLTIPLCGRAMQILKGLPRVNSFVFGGQRAGQPIGLREMAKIMSKLNKASPHGLRASFKTWAHDHTEFAPDTIEAALGHEMGTVVERDYNRGQLLDKRRVAMDAWANFILPPKFAHARA
jgi:integrase